MTLCPILARSTIGIVSIVVLLVTLLIAFPPLSVAQAPPVFPGQAQTADSLTKRVPNWTKDPRILELLRGPDSTRIRDSLNRADSLISRNDSLKIDTTRHWVAYLDSTARMEQMAYHRTDAPSVEMFPRTTPSLFLDINSAAYQREMTLDSTGQYVTIREKVNGVDVKLPTRMTLDEYIHMRYQEEKRRNWRSMVVQYTIRQDRDQLGNILGSLTNIQIPVPANPLLDIFGGKGINLRISGGVDIRGAFRSTSTDQSTINAFDQSHSEPDFNQDVQIAVSGTIGTKLNIRADWNTQRTFEYENQLKIAYTGYEDEIVQSVEAGNVSLSTPSLVGGGQALFGVKAKFQAGPLTLTTLVSQKKGQVKELSVSGGSTQNQITIRPEGYSLNHFFVDTLYAQYFEALHKSQSPVLTAAMNESQIRQIDVYLSMTGGNIAQDQSLTQANAYISLPVRDSASLTYRVATLQQLEAQDRATAQFETGLFRKLVLGKDYKVDYIGGYITILTSVSNDQIVAVRYTADPTGERWIGTDENVKGSTVALKLVKPKNLTPSKTTCWAMMLKNFYPTNAANVKQDNFTVKISRLNAQNVQQEILGDFSFLQILGLDRFNNDGSPGRDDKFDFMPGITVDPDRGEIIFPTLRPFDSAIVRFYRDHNLVAGDSLLVHSVYDTTSDAAQYTTNNKYQINVTAAGVQTGRYNLGFNIVEGSVQVLLNGRALQPNVDYTVDYIVGEVVVRNTDALLPGANLQVKYEQNDLFQLASKTLIGARGEMPNILPNTNIGFTIMNLNQATLSDKVRLGEEPTSNMIMGVDASTNFNLPFLTSLIDALPLIRTKEMSTIRLGGELAWISPDANTMKSTVTTDNGVSIAYIDDFEGARRTIPLPIYYTGWSLASPPVTSLLGRNLPDTTVSFSKAHLTWYNNSNSFLSVTTQDIWPQRQTRSGQNFVTVMRMEYDPNRRGVYNYSPNVDSTLHREAIGTPNAHNGYNNDPVKRRKNWAGIMRYIGTTAGNVLTQNIQYLEIWAKIDVRDSLDLMHGRMFVDIGQVSEGVIPGTHRLMSEDLLHTVSNPAGIPNGVMTAEKDVGLDTLTDEQERSVYKNFLDKNEGDPDVERGDPSGDDYQPYVQGTPIPFKFNGTENNWIQRDPSGLYPNTEDLNTNGVLDETNSYLEYEVPVGKLYLPDSGNQGPLVNPRIVGGGNKGWYQFRIPLFEDPSVPPGETVQSVLQNVQNIRLWVTGFSYPVTIQIAQFDLVGNQWIERTKNDSMMKASVVSLEEDSAYAREWAEQGISRAKDRTDPNQVILTNEQSLSLIINDLPIDSSRQVVKYFIARPMDIFTYKQMKMLVHGDQSFNYISPDEHDAEVYLRFGTDSLNFYEFREPLRPGWDVPNNQMVIDFARLTSVKTLRQTDSLADPGSIYYIDVDGRVLPRTMYYLPGGGDRTPSSANRKKVYVFPKMSGARYGIFGNPSLRTIKEISIGVINTNSMKPLRGQVWANELRLVDVDNSGGGAYRFDTQIKLADLGQIGFNYTRTDPNFHALDQRFGSMTTTTGWGVSANVALEKFLPLEWQGSTLPFSYSHSEGLTKPKYVPGSDIVVTEAAGRMQSQAAADNLTVSSQTLHVQDSYSVSNFKVAIPTDRWYIRDTFNKLAMRFSYNTSHDRDPVTISRDNWAWNAGISYSVGLPTDYFIQPFQTMFKGLFVLDEFRDWKLYFIPLTGLSGALNGARGRSLELSRTLGSLPRENRSFTVDKSAGFDWKLSEGGLSNLSGNYGVQVSRNLLPLDNDSVGRGFGALLNSLLFGGQDNRLGQRLTVNSKPRIPNILNVTKYLDLSFGYGVSYAWQNTFQGGDVGKSAGWDNNITMQMNLKLKSLFDPIFAVKDEPQAPAGQQQDFANRRSRGDEARRLAEKAVPDTTHGAAPPDTSKKAAPVKPAEQGKSIDIIGQIRSIARIFIKIPLLDYESVNISWTQTNRSQNSGVVGSTGFQNFWGRMPFQGSLVSNGPSRLYQLGLVTDPSASYKFTTNAPFLVKEFKDLRGGIRAANASLVNQFNQTNTISLRTNRPLWEGASMDINWKVGWNYLRNATLITDASGFDTSHTIPGTSGSVERSYLTLPPVLLFKYLHSDLQNVGKEYKAKVDAGLPTSQLNAALAQSFEKGMEALPFLSKILGGFVPRPNWTLRWDGIEKVGGLSTYVDRLSLEHSYTSSFNRSWRAQPTNGQMEEQTDAERISYGFSPLAGINATFKEIFKGSLTGSFRYNTTTTLDLNLAQSNIVEGLAQEISLSLTYSRQGFSFPLFGVNLSNDVDISLTYSRTKNTRRRYDPIELADGSEGLPLEGSTRTMLEPRIRYVLSTRITTALYYRYSKTAPDEGGSTTFGTTTNEAGVNLHIAIGS